MKKRTPFKETKFGIWLKEHDSELFAFVADIMPDKKGWRVMKKIFLKMSELTDEKRKEGIALLEAEK